MLILPQRRRIVKPTPGEVWLHGNPHNLAKGLVFAGGISSDHGGTRYFDFAGKNHGTLTLMDPATDWVPSPNGWALDFDGTDDWVSIPHSDTVKPPLPITIVALVKLNSLLATTASIFQSNDSAAYRGVGLWLTGAEQLFANYGDGGGTGSGDRRSKVGTTILGVGSWYHLASVIRGAADFSLYVNGKDDAGTHSGTGTDMVYDSTVGSIGRFTPASTFSPISVGAVMLYNRALSASEIAELYEDPGFTWATRPRRRVFGFTAAGGGITADLAVTLADDTLASTAAVQVTADLSKTLDADTLTSTATLPIVADAAITLEDDTLTSETDVTVTADLSKTLDHDTLSAAAAVTVTADAGITEDNDTLSSTVGVQVTADLSVTLDDDTLSSTLIIGTPPVTADLNVTLDGDSLDSTATVTVVASLVKTLDNDTLSATGTFEQATVTAVLEAEFTNVDQFNVVFAASSTGQFDASFS